MAHLFPALVQPPMTSAPRRDLAGALSAALVSLPQTLAYGVIAVAACGPDWTGLGVLAGLYGSVLAGCLAVILGSNPLVVTGPRAATVLVFAALVGQLAAMPGMSTGAALAFACLALALAGLMQMAFGLLRLGRLADFMPYPVIAGFLNGSALLIVLSQLGPITGLTEAGNLGELVADLPRLQPGTLLLALGTAAVILAAPRLSKRVPPSLVGIGFGSAAFWLGHWAGFGAALGGTIPPLPDAGGLGLVDPAALGAALAAADSELLAALLPAALSMAALSALDAVLTAVAIDQVTLRRSDPNRELFAQGAANAACGLLGLLPCSGSMSRTAPLLRAGARSALAPLLTAGLVAVVTIGLAPLVSLLPKAVMAGLLLVVGVELFDRWTIGLLRRTRWSAGTGQSWGDLAAIAVVVATTLAFNLVAAVGVGTLVALLFFVLRIARSPVRRCYRASALEARLHGDGRRLAFLRRHGEAIAVLELDGTLFFGSVAALRREAEALVAAGVVHVVLDLKRVKELDATAARAIERLQAQLASKGGCLALAYVEPERRRHPTARRSDGERRSDAAERRLWRALDQAGSLAVLKPEAIQPDLDGALQACERHLAARVGRERAVHEIERADPAILRGLDRRALRRLRPCLSRCAVPAGTMLFRQGDEPDAIWFVAAGRVEVTVDVPRSDRKMRVQTLSAGAIFGEMAVIDPKPRSANVAALDDAVCYRLAADDFVRLKLEQPDLAFALLENLALIFAERLRASNVMMAELEA